MLWCHGLSIVVIGGLYTIDKFLQHEAMVGKREESTFKETAVGLLLFLPVISGDSGEGGEGRDPFRSMLVTSKCIHHLTRQDKKVKMIKKKEKEIFHENLTYFEVFSHHQFSV